MLRQFGVPRPLAPMRPMLGVSNADAPFIETKPAMTAKEIGMAYLQAASASQPYYNLLPKAFDVMQPAPAGARKAHRLWPSLTSEEDSRSDRSEQWQKRSNKDHHRRRTVSTPAARHHRSRRRYKASSSTVSSGESSDNLDRSARSGSHSDKRREAKPRERKTENRCRRETGKESRRSRSRPFSPAKRRDKHRKRHSDVYSPLFPSQPLQSLPTGVVYFRDIPPNIPISQFEAQPQFSAPRQPVALQHQSQSLHGAHNGPVAAPKLPRPPLPPSVYQNPPTLQPHLPLSHAQVAGKACPYIRDHLRADAIPLPSNAVSFDILQATEPDKRVSASDRAASIEQSSKPVLPPTKELDSSENTQLLQAEHTDLAEEMSDGLSLANDAERVAIAQSSRRVQLWRNKLSDLNQDPPTEGPWSFSTRAWHTGILHAGHENRLGHLTITYRHRGDDEVTSFRLKKPFNPSVKDDIRAIRTACKDGMHLVEVIQAGIPTLFRFTWKEGDGDKAERDITDLLILGRIRRGRPYIMRHHYRDKALKGFDGGYDLDTQDEGNKNASRKSSWRWPLQEAPTFARWTSASDIEKMEVAFRPAYPERCGGCISSRCLC